MGGRVSLPELTAPSRRLIDKQERSDLSRFNAALYRAGARQVAARQLPQASVGVHVSYYVTYPRVASGPSKDLLTASTKTQLNTTIAKTGAVTASLRSYGFTTARADKVAFEGTPGSGSLAPTAAPTVRSPGKISSASGGIRCSGLLLLRRGGVLVDGVLLGGVLLGGVLLGFHKWRTGGLCSRTITPRRNRSRLPVY